MKRPARYARPWWRSPWFWALLVWFNLGPAYFRWVYFPIEEKLRRTPPEHLVSPEIDRMLVSDWISVPLTWLGGFPLMVITDPLSDAAHWVGKRMGYSLGWTVPAQPPGEPVEPRDYDPEPFRQPMMYLSTLILASGIYFFVRRARYELEIIRGEDEAAERSGGDSRL